MIFYHPDCDLRLSDYGIEIPIVDDRASRVFENLKALDPTLSYFDFNKIPKLTCEDLLLAHNPDFVDRIFGEYRELERELMTSYELVDSEGKYHRYNPQNATKDFNYALDIILKQAGMTFFSSQEALKSGFSYFLGGGMHHAMSFSGRGFCLINDIVITLRKMQNENLIKTAWVIDIDAHKGDGTAELTARDESIVSMSIHMKEGWPLDSGSVRDPWFIPCNVVIVVDGADPYEHDELPSTDPLKLTAEQMLLRNKMVYDFLRERKIPQSYVMAGGYGKRSWEIYTQFLKFVWQSSSKGSEISSR